MVAFWAVGSQIAANRYLQSPAFRTLLEWQAGQSFQSHAEIAPLQVDGRSAYSERLRFYGGPRADFNQFEAWRVRATIRSEGWFNKRWVIQEVLVGQARLDLHHPDPDLGEPEPERPQHWSDVFLLLFPRSIDLENLVFEDATVVWPFEEDAPGSLRQTRITATQDGSAWLFRAHGGTVIQPGLPSLQLEEADVRWQDPALFVRTARLNLESRGRVELSGEFDTESPGRFDTRVGWEEIPVQMLFSQVSAVGLSGDVRGHADVEGHLDDLDAVRVVGRAEMTDARLEAFPMLGQLASFIGDDRFRSIRFQEVTANLEWSRKAGLQATNFRAESPGLMLIEGDFVVVGDQIDGEFELGVAEADLRWIPGARERVFTESRGGYAWTEFTLKGPVDRPTENLSGRLVAAARDQVFEDLTQGTEGAGEALRDAAEQIFDFFRRRD